MAKTAGGIRNGATVRKMGTRFGFSSTAYGGAGQDRVGLFTISNGELKRDGKFIMRTSSKYFESSLKRIYKERERI